MANALDSLKIALKIEVENQQKLTELKKAFQDLGKAGGADAAFDRLKNALKGVMDLQPKTIQGFKDQISILGRISRNLDTTSKEYLELTDAIKRAKQEMKALQNQASAKPPAPPAPTMGGMISGFMGSKGLGMKGGLMAGAKQALPIATTTALATALPGQTGYAAMAGGAVGGLGGAVAGGLIGLGVAGTVGMVQAADAAAKYSSEIKRLEIALKGVTKTDKEFAKAQAIVADVSNELNVPIGDATKQFTTLSASVIGAGGDVDQAEEVFRGVSEAIKATGGDAEDVQSAMRAMSQIFGKGKVSAEELQGQLGERLPGAVTKFAEATGRTLPQLQKDLRDGTVGLNDVMKFVAKLSKDHRDAALKMAGDSAEAGARLTVAMQRLQKNIGDILQPIGAWFQDVFAEIVKWINKAIEAFNRFFGIGTQNAIDALEKRIARIQWMIDKGMTGVDKDKFQDLKNRLKELRDLQEETGKGSFQQPAEDQDKFSVEGDKAKAEKLMKEYVDGLGAVQTHIAKTFIGTFSKMTDALVNFVKTGKLEFNKLARSIIADIMAMFIKARILAPIMQSLGIGGGGGGIGGWLSGLFGRNKTQDISSMTTQQLVDRDATLYPNNTVPEGSFNITPVDPTYGTGIPSGANLPEGSFSITPERSNIYSGLRGINNDELNPYGNALGNIYGENGIVPFARGGIVNRPTLFPFAKGVGLMGEAGPEAIVPLKRGKDGKLGIAGGGGGNITNNIVVNVKTEPGSGSGKTDVKAASSQLNMFGKAISVAVQQELVKQSRPGGLLTRG